MYDECTIWLVIDEYAGGIVGYFGCVDAGDIEAQRLNMTLVAIKCERAHGRMKTIAANQ
ncbi:hypothetical protein M002_27630 [Pseudomonas aeruginosa ID4365]|nr:hypothetical protein M002_27630 [Pseudomonas aeruginosa ID4365]